MAKPPKLDRSRRDLEIETFGQNASNEIFTRVGNSASDPLTVDVDGAVEGSFTPGGLNTALEISKVTVTTTAAKIPATPLNLRNSMIIHNQGTSSIFIGNSDVTASGVKEGWEIDASSYFSLDITDNIEIYAICASGTVNVKILELA